MAEKGKKQKGKKKEATPKNEDKVVAKDRTRVIVRVLGADLDGERVVKHAILKIKGVGHSFANAFCAVAKIDPEKKLGSFTESEITNLEEQLKDPEKLGIPKWMLNRRRDIETGEDMHMTSSGVDVSEKFDIQRMIDKKTYKGARHMLGLPVRGQRTRSSFRRGKTVGVVRKAIKMQQQPSGKGGKGGKKK